MPASMRAQTSPRRCRKALISQGHACRSACPPSVAEQHGCAESVHKDKGGGKAIRERSDVVPVCHSILGLSMALQTAPVKCKCSCLDHKQSCCLLYSCNLQGRLPTNADGGCWKGTVSVDLEGQGEYGTHNEAHSRGV